MSDPVRGGDAAIRSGLSALEATRQRARYGPNALPERQPLPLWRRLARQLASPLVYLLLFALALDLTLWLIGGRDGLPLEVIAIAVILALNASLGVWQELKGEGALARLRSLTAPTVWVHRDGQLIRLPAIELVPEDLIRLEAGDRVPADAVLVESVDLALDESTLTGESLPVERDRGGEILAGTLMTRGQATARVLRTGSASALGRLAVLMNEIEEEPTPLERRLDLFGRRVGRWVMALAAALAVGGLAIEGIGQLGRIVLFAVAVAVAAVPEGLPAILTATLALGVERMARRKAVVRRLSAVEALGSVTVVATDKTGTLTANRLEVRDLVADDPRLALLVMTLANDAELGSEAGDPVDRALLEGVQARGGDVSAIREECPRLESLPFDANRRFMRVTVLEAGRELVCYKGAPEVLLARSTLDSDDRARWSERVARQGAAGFRVLGLGTGAADQDRLTMIGLVSLWDPPRPEVAAAVATARSAGLRIVMVTGDHQATAATVAAAVGIDAGPVLTGADIDGLDPAGLEAAVATTAIFARMAPEHKLRVVEALQARGEIVAVTGDGVNDAPALKRADVGIAMGQRGADVAREAADLILLDDNFATIVAAIEEGRSIYENIRKFVRFLFSTNLSEIIVVTVGAGLAFALGTRDQTGALLLPLTAAQLLWINLITDGAPALALAFDRNPGVMSRPPRDPREPLLDRRSLAFIVWSGSLKAIIALGLLIGLRWWGSDPIEPARTATFFFMAAGQLLFVYPARKSELEPPTNRWLHLAVAISGLLQIGTVTLTVLLATFETRRLGLGPAVLTGAAIVVAWGAAELVGRVVHRGTRMPAPRAVAGPGTPL